MPKPVLRYAEGPDRRSQKQGERRGIAEPNFKASAKARWREGRREEENSELIPAPNSSRLRARLRFWTIFGLQKKKK
jgi:hypothetical protein